LIHTPIQKS